MSHFYPRILIITLLLGMPCLANAQIIGAEAFMGGDYIEVGVSTCGGYGTNGAPPAGYHPRSPGGGLGFVADPARDGWYTGSPNYCGDFFLPGSPVEGFAVEVGSVSPTSYYNSDVCGGGSFNVPGGIIGYSPPPNMSVTWEGAVGGLSVQIITSMHDTNAYFIGEVTLCNITPNMMEDVYFLRQVDPDNDVELSSSYTTINEIVSQPTPADCDALVTAQGTVYGTCFLGLGSRDKRARVSYGGFSLTAASNCSAVWNGTSPYSGAGTSTADEAISIAFKEDTLLANECATFYYAYILDVDDLEKALGATLPHQIFADGTDVTDTSRVGICRGSSTYLQITQPISYDWTWSPAYGLDTTEGTNVWASPDTTTTYTAVGVGACDTIEFDFTVDVVDLLTDDINAQPDTLVCVAAPVRLHAEGGVTYAWSPAASLDDSTLAEPLATPVATTDYSVTVTNSIGCMASDTITVVVDTPIIDAGPDLGLCAGESVTLGGSPTGPAFLSYTWTSTPFSGTSYLDDFTALNPVMTAPLGSGGTTITYYVVGSDASGCSGDDTVNVDIYPEIVATMSGFPVGDSICSGDPPLNLTLSPTGGTLYGPGTSAPNAFDPAVAGTGTHTIYYTYADPVTGCDDTTSHTIMVVGPPVFGSSTDTTLCAGDVIVLDAYFPGATYLWQDGATTPTYTVTGPGTYHVETTSFCGINNDTTNIAYSNLASVSLTADTIVCSGDSITLYASSDTGHTYLWDDGTVGPSRTITSGGTYWVDATNYCTTDRDSIIVTQELFPDITLAADTTLCPGETLLLTASFPGATTTWQDASMGPTYLVTSAGTYWASTSNICGADNDTINVAYDVAPAVSLPADTLVCIGDTLMIPALTSSPHSFVWDDGSIDSIRPIFAAGTYTVDASNYCGTATASINISSDIIPSVDLRPDTMLCTGDVVLLNPPFAGGSYLWQDGSGGPNYLVSSPGEYWVQVSNVCGVVSDTTDISYHELPAVYAGPDTLLCIGTPVTLTATSDTAHVLVWDNGTIGSTRTVNVGGTYWVSGTNYCGTAWDTVIVDDEIAPVTNLGADTILCGGDTRSFDVSWSNATYLWQDGSTSPTYTASSAGTYWVVVTNPCGTDSDTMNIEYSIDPGVFVGNDTLLCIGSPMTLTAQADTGHSFVWDDGSTGPTRVVSVGGTYWVDATNYCGTVRDEIVITDEVAPITDLGADTTLCPGDTRSFDVSWSNATYQWQDGSTSPTYTVTIPGTYWVVVTNPCGVDSDTVVVDYDIDPAVYIGEDTLICQGDAITLYAQSPANHTYVWDNFTTDSSRTITTGGTYYVDATNYCGTVRDEITIVEEVPPVVNLGPDELDLCEGDVRILNATFNGNGVDPTQYLWHDGSIQPNYTADQTGLYYVTLSNICGVATDSIEFAYEAMPEAYLPDDTVICRTEPVRLVASYTGVGHQWWDGTNDPEKFVYDAGTYTLEALGTYCPSDIATINVQVVDTPVVDLGMDEELCLNETRLLNATNLGAGITYEWQDGGIAPAYEVENPGGVYWVVVRSACGSATDTVSFFYEDCQCLLHIPTAFTPNGDGVNDNFRGWFNCQMLSYNMKIFNRFGELVYETDDHEQPWDGVYKGQEQPLGVYAFYVTYTYLENGIQQTETVEGDVTLLR